jgi:hypothetical protein
MDEGNAVIEPERRQAATETVRIAGWVFSVSFKLASGPVKQSDESENPSTRSAESKTSRASG